MQTFLFCSLIIINKTALFLVELLEKLRIKGYRGLEKYISSVWLWGLFLDFMDNLQNCVFQVLINTVPDFPEYLPLF